MYCYCFVLRSAAINFYFLPLVIIIWLTSPTCLPAMEMCAITTLLQRPPPMITFPLTALLIFGIWIWHSHSGLWPAFLNFHDSSLLQWIPFPARACSLCKRSPQQSRCWRRVRRRCARHQRFGTHVASHYYECSNGQWQQHAGRIQNIICSGALLEPPTTRALYKWIAYAHSGWYS